MDGTGTFHEEGGGAVAAPPPDRGEDDPVPDQESVLDPVHELVQDYAQDAGSDSDEGDFGLFGVDGKTIAVHIDHLAELAHIDGLHQGIGADENSLGLIPVRGVLVPVLDAFGNYRRDGRRPKTAAILGVDGQFAGLAIDEVIGLRRFPMRTIQQMAGSAVRRLSAGMIYLDDDLIHVLDAPILLQDDAMPRALLDPRKSLRADRGLSTPFLTFLTGGVSFAVRADRIVGTVPQRVIEDGTGAGGVFLGTISYYGRRLPILASNLVFGLGDSARIERFETVVLRMPDDRLIGLAAERIVRAVNGKQGADRPLDEHIEHSVRLLRSTVTFDDNIHFVVDEDRLFEEPRVISIARLSDAAVPSSDHRIVVAERDQGSVAFEKERYLLVEAGMRIGIRITDIDAMRTPPRPEDILRTDLQWPGFAGLLVFDGKLAPLVRLAEHLGRSSPPDQSQQRMIMSSIEGRQVAFLADRLTGIGTSDWVSQDDQGKLGGLAVASLKFEGQSEVRHLIDLRALSRALLDFMSGQQGAGQTQPN